MYQRLQSEVSSIFVNESTAAMIAGTIPIAEATPIGGGRYSVCYHGMWCIIDTNTDKESDVLFTITLDEDKCSGVDIEELL